MYYTTNQVQNASADFEECLVILNRPLSSRPGK